MLCAQAAPHLLDQAPPEPFQRSRAAPALDMSSLLAPADPTHRRMISDAESVVGSQAHPQQQAQQQAQPPLLASPIGGVVEQARGFRAEPERHEGSAALHQPPEGPSFSPLGDALPHQPAPPAWAADFQPRVPGDLAVTPSEDADDDGGLVDDLLDLLPAHSGIAVEQGSAEVGPTHQQQGLDRGPAGMHSVSSLHDWVGSQRAASAPPAESDRDTASMVSLAACVPPPPFLPLQDGCCGAHSRQQECFPTGCGVPGWAEGGHAVLVPALKLLCLPLAPHLCLQAIAGTPDTVLLCLIM